MKSVAGQPELDSRLPFPGVILCKFMLVVGRSRYGKPLLYSHFFDTFTEGMKNARGQFGSVYLGSTRKSRLAAYLQALDNLVRGSSSVPQRIMKGG